MNNTTAVDAATTVKSMHPLIINQIMSEHACVKGERVNTVGGMHKRCKHGMFVESHGKKMTSVKTDGDRKRNLWLSSMSPMPKRKPDNVVLS